MTVNVLLKISVVYCAVSSVAAPPRHPAPSISDTSVGARECGFVIRVVRELVHARLLSRNHTLAHQRGTLLVFEIEGAGCRGGAATLLTAQ